MTPINLEDVESYLVKMVGADTCPLSPTLMRSWIRDRFAELRAREAAVIRGP